MWNPSESSDTADAVETERWCAGLVSVGSLPMEALEHAELTRRLQRVLGAFGLLLVTATALAAWPFGLPLAIWDAADLQSTLWVAAASASWMLALPVALLLTLDLGRRARQYFRDLREGEIECFEGSLDGARLEPEQRLLLKGAAFVATPEGGQRLRVFPHSRVVRMPSRHGRARWRVVRVRTVAPPPGYEMRVVIPRETVGVSDPSVEILRRRMTADERREVLMRAARLHESWRLLLLQGLTGLILYAAVFRLVADHAAVAIVSVIGVVAWTAHRARRPVDAIRLAKRLRRDAEAGLVLTHRRHEATAPAEEPMTRAEHDPWVDVEFLPVSSLSWTVHGRPARWRDLMAPAWRMPFSRR